MKNTHFFPLSRKVSNSTDILQHNAFRRCPMEQFVLIKWPPRMEKYTEHDQKKKTKFVIVY